MEKEMETDEEMEEVTDKPFVWEEIDLDYEFDVAMYYDFTRPETEKEIKEAEDWFKFAGTYPPSRKHFVFLFHHLPLHAFDFVLIFVINGHVMELFCSAEFDFWIFEDAAFSKNSF